MTMHAKTLQDVLQRRVTSGKIQTITREELEFGMVLEPPKRRRYAVITPEEAMRRTAAGWTRDETRWYAPKHKEVRAWQQRVRLAAKLAFSRD